MHFEDQSPEKGKDSILLKNLADRGFASYLTDDIRAKLQLLDIRESSTGKERSHGTDIVEIIDVIEKIKEQASTLPIPHPQSEEEWQSLKAAFIFEDIGKAASPEVAGLYALNDVPIARTMGENMRTHIGDDFLENHQNPIRDFVTEAKASMEYLQDTHTPIEEYKTAWNAKLENLKGPDALMRYFWDAHAFHSVKILEQNKKELLQGGISEENYENIRRIAGGHHFLEGNSMIKNEEINTLTIWGELLDKVHAGMTRFNNLSLPIDERWHKTWNFINEQRIARLPESEIKSRYERIAHILEHDLKKNLLKQFTEIEKGKAS